jgi:hypothetical protein
LRIAACSTPDIGFLLDQTLLLQKFELLLSLKGLSIRKTQTHILQKE